jgi:anti-sigma B factor antagonist
VELQITGKHLRGIGIVLGVHGRLDAATAPELKTTLKRLVTEGHHRLVVDLTEVSFIDSSGLSALVSGLKATREAGGTLKLAGLNEQTRTAFRLTLLDRVFEIYPDLVSMQGSLAGS